MFFSRVKKYSALIFFTTLVFSIQLYAQESLPESDEKSAQTPSEEELVLSVEDAVKLAFEGNLSLKQQKITLNQSLRSKNFSWNSVSPSLSASASYSSFLPNQNESDASLTVRGTASLALSPSLWTSIRGAALSYENQEISYESAKRTIELNVRKAFYGLLYAQENINLQESNVESSRKQYESNNAKYTNGTISRLDVLSTQVTYQNAKLNLESARTSWENDMSSFKQSVGIPQEKKVRLEGNLDDFLNIGEISVENALESSLTVRQLEKQIESAKNSLLATRFSAWAPSLNASYSFSAGKGSDGKFSTDNPSYGGSITLSASIPLDGYLPWSSGALSIASQKDNLAILELQLEDAKTSLLVTVESCLKKIEQEKENIKLRESSIDLAKQTYEMSLTAYNRGTRDLLSLQNAQDSLFSAQVNLKSEAYTLISTILDLENAIGAEFGTLVK